MKLTHLDWFRFHGKQYTIKLLQNAGFYDITIKRKMSLEESKSFIVIAGICLSTEEGAVYGKAQIFDDSIVSDDSFAGDRIREIMSEYIEHKLFVEHSWKKDKPKYLNYKINK